MHGYFRWFEILNRFFIGNEIIFKVNASSLAAGQNPDGADLRPIFSKNLSPPKRIPSPGKNMGPALAFSLEVIITDK